MVDLRCWWTIISYHRITNLLRYSFRRVEVDKEEILIDEKVAEPITIPDLEDAVVTESGMRRKQLEKMAIDKPDEFAKLLRTWLAED